MKAIANKAKPSIIVIGAGIGGLTAGALLAKRLLVVIKSSF